VNPTTESGAALSIPVRGRPHSGGVENGDDIDAAVGGWIAFELVEVLSVR